VFSDNYISHFVLVGADVNPIKRSDWTPLMLVCTKLGSMALDTAHVLLNHKADPHIMNKDGWTALHIACRIGHRDIVELLLQHFPALVNVRSNNGRFPLHIASKYILHSSFCYTYLIFIRKPWLSVYFTIHVHLCTGLCKVQTQACMHFVTNFWQTAVCKFGFNVTPFYHYQLLISLPTRTFTCLALPVHHKE
jgi:hypothetical protein